MSELRARLPVDDGGVAGNVDDPFCSERDPFLDTGKNDRKLQTNKQYQQEARS